jgi:hypothetical protein
MDARTNEGTFAPGKGRQPQLALEGEPLRVDILHKVGIKSSSLNDVYKALTTTEGLSG